MYSTWDKLLIVHSAAVSKGNFFENSASGSKCFLKEFFALISNLKSELEKKLRVFFKSQFNILGVFFWLNKTLW